MEASEVLVQAGIIALGFVVGNLLFWVITYFVGKKTILSMVKSLSENPEVVKWFKALRKKVLEEE